MLRIKPRYRPWIFLFALWLAFEPFAVAVVRANDQIPTPKTQTMETEGIVAIDEVMTPVEYLEYMLELRGLLKEDLDTPEKARAEIEAKAWADWMMSMSNIYQMMSAKEHDVFSFYSAASTFHRQFDIWKDSKEYIREFKEGLPGFIKILSNAAKKTAFMFAHMGKNNVTKHGKNLFNSFARVTGKTAKVIEKSRTFEFLEHFAAPTTALAKGSKLTESQQYFRWVKKTMGRGDNKFTISNVKGVARTAGIGLEVLSLALDSYQLATSEDLKTGRFTFNDTCAAVGALISAATLICMFVPGGQIVAVVALVWIAISRIAEAVGEYNKKWKEAYVNSYWFLYQNDPTFKSFMDNRGRLKKQEKSISLLLAEKDFGDKLKAQSPQTDEEKDAHKRGVEIFEALEKQGVLMTYYQSVGFTLPDFDLNRLQDLWSKKASYMAWKPNEEELKEEQNRGFWGKLGHVINPMTYVAMAGDKLSSRGYQKELKNSDIKRVFFNPDYVLVKKYKNYLIGRKLKGGLFDAVGIRIEQSPFNYIPLVGIDSSAWSSELFTEAFQADSFIVGSKEMQYFREQAKVANEQVEKLLEEQNESLKGIDKDFMPTVKKQREALSKLAEGLKSDPEAANDALFDQCKRAFGWNWNSGYGPKSPRNIVAHYKADIEQRLEFVPISVGQRAAETVLMVTAVKQVRDTGKLMGMLVKEREETLANFESEFKNEAIRRYLKEGTFLNVSGGGFMDWLSGIYTAHDEMEKWTKLFRKEVETYVAYANEASTSRETGHLWWSFTVRDPLTVLKDLNAEMRALKAMVATFEQAGGDIEQVVSSDNQNVFPDREYQPTFDPNATLDPDQEVMAPNPVMPVMSN